MELKERIESTVVTRTFNVSGMPESIFFEVDEFCKLHYGDSRWSMIADLVRAAKDDFKFKMLYDEIQQLKAEVASLKPQEVPKPKERFKSFGGI